MSEVRRARSSESFRSLSGAFAAALLALAAAAAAPPAAQAQEDMGFFGYGGRIGASIDPDQFTIGGYAKLGRVTKMLKFRPSVDLGFGDHVTSVLGNADVQVDFVDVNGPYKPFAGAGLGIAYYNIDGGGDDSEVGLNFYGGIEKSFGTYNHGYAEIRIGVDDMPDLKFTLGYGWY